MKYEKLSYYLFGIFFGLIIGFKANAQQVQYFKTGSAVPTALLVKELQNIYDLQIKDKNLLSVEVVGHTDQRGNDSYNQVLSEKRAESTVVELVKMGVPKEKIKASGKGESDLLTTGTTQSDRASNRRVVVSILTDKDTKVIVVSESKTEVKCEVREVVKEVKVEPRKNRISLLVGQGSKEGLKTTASSTKVDIESKTGVVLGLQYQRLITERVSLGIVGLNSKAGLINIGWDF